MKQTIPLLDVKDMVVHFPGNKTSLFDLTDRTVKAVNSVSLTLQAGETLGLVGESGSGKSTFGRAILQLGETSSGTVQFDGVDLTQGGEGDVAWLRRETAMIFQDPYGALNPRMSVGSAIAEALKVHQKIPLKKVKERVHELLKLVGMDVEFQDRRPGDLSGGQCQRIGIARALAIEPRLIIADECVAALDVSIQGQIINLLIELKARMNLSMIFIAHDLAIVRRLCDRVAVMYLGKIVEEGSTEQVFKDPQHPYTISLINSIPDINPDRHLPDSPLGGEPPSPVLLPSGCAFHPRCPEMQAGCMVNPGPILLGYGGHKSACILPQQL